MAKQRIQKWLGSTGILSRRKAEEALLSGRITVNEKIITELGTQIDPEVDQIKLDGLLVTDVIQKTTLMFYKPRAVITSLFDPEGRPIISDYLPDSLKKLRPIGRLDFLSEGLILLTNDGELANQIAHPRYEIEKEYHVSVAVTDAGTISDSILNRLTTRVDLEDGPGHFKAAQILKKSPEECLLKIIIAEGRNRFIRRMFDTVGYPVLQLIRVRIGGLNLETLKPGLYRSLSSAEIQKILNKN